MTAEIIPLTGCGELLPPETIASRCIAAGLDDVSFDRLAMANAIVAAIEAERAHADVLRKRCARLTKALLAEQERWKAEWA